MDSLIQTSQFDTARSIKMETRWLGNVSSSSMLIVLYSPAPLKSDLSENMALLLNVHNAMAVIWQWTGKQRVDSYSKVQVGLATEEIQLS